LFSRENVVIDKAMQNTIPISTMGEFDAPPTIDELRKAIDALSCGKAPSSDAIPAKTVKAGKENSLLRRLHELLLLCRDEGTLHKDLWDVKIVTLHKNKSDHSD
jgi:hypothetical protein